MKFIKYFFYSFLILFLVSACTSDVQEVQQTSSFEKFNFFAQNEIIELTLKTDFGNLLNNETDSEDEYQPAVLEFKNTDIEYPTEEILVRPRGVTRRKICNFPPLKLKFPNTVDRTSLKLVTHCQQEEELASLALREYLVYKMYNLLTEYSLRVQLVKIQYEDTPDQNDETGTSVKYPTKEKFGFLIEEDEMLAARMNANVLETPMQLKFIDKEHSKLFSLFQYVIGNTDWNLTKRHNLKVLTPKDRNKRPVAIPYDFDYAGFVNAPYAIPHPDLPIENVRDRHFMWRGKDRKGFAKAIATMKEKKAAILDLIQNFPYLDDTEKQDLVSFIEESYSMMEGEVEI